MDAAQAVHEKLLAALASGRLPDRADAPDPAAAGLTRGEATDIFLSQLTSRQMDRLSRHLQTRGEGFYTIGSSGHEGNAAVAAALRVTDMAFLHYRSNAFQLHRSRQLPGATPTWDMLLSFAASSEDPISGGRHKVIGSKPLNIPPQTSTIASHLPKAVGAAFSIGIARRIGMQGLPLPDDAVVLASFGDASANHSTAQGAFNTAGWAAFQGSPMPLIFLCEDNGIGISTKSPRGWVRANFENRPGIRYFACDGLDMFETYRVAGEAAEYVRTRRKPAFLHMRTIRLYGHAGADMAMAYLSREEVEAEEASDPLLHMVRQLAEAEIMEPAEALAVYSETAARVARIAAQVVQRPRLQDADQVMQSLIPPKRDCAPLPAPDPALRDGVFDSDMAAMQKPQPMGKIINLALADLMLSHPDIVMMGEDIARKGGNYGITQRLSARFGKDRVIDTLLDEQAILGLAIGMAQNGFLPMPEIQFLAYLHNAEDQLRGEAATLPFFSDGQFTNPMVVRISGFGYQRGFGGHFHNDNSVAVLRDIPGLILCTPSNGRDAALMLRECVRLAREEQRLVVFLEPIALYAMRDLHTAGDGGWLTLYPDPAESISLGEVGVHGTGTELAIVTFANGAYLARQALPLLAQRGIDARVIDIRWLSPLPASAIAQAVAACRAALIVDETRRTGGVAEALMALLDENADLPKARLTAEDSFIPTGPAYAATMPSRDSIVDAAVALVEGLR